MINVPGLFFEDTMKAVHACILFTLLATPGCGSKRPFILHTTPVKGHEPLLDDYGMDEEINEVIEAFKDDLITSQPTDDSLTCQYEEQYEEFTEEQFYERPLVEVKK